MMSMAEVISRAPFFQGLSPEIVEQLASVAVMKRYLAGEVIFEEGDRGIGFHLVAEGRVKIYKMSADGREQILHIFGPGEPFGEAAVFLALNYPARALALTDTATVFFPREALRRLLAQNPDISFAMMGIMAQRLVRFAGLLESITLREAPARLAAFILDLAGAEPTAELIITKNQIASLLGTTPETISRAFGRLKNAGLITEEKPYLTILDRRRLQKTADGLEEV
ncbi:Crp/Fnr family transcriptional regulator [Deltaproteobacteria bacterium OttesenSCG-928-M10]|nr:Crp/Fnr family transcriptional regulator [Deltaproteobacteria bacterium OttesenSCG-928-M10]